MKYYVLLLAVALLGLSGSPAQAQGKSKVKVKGDARAVSAANRLQPLFGGITAAQAEALMGPAFLADIDRSFGSRAEASTFFATKGYEYLNENQPDTATYRFNLAWLLNPQNVDAYRGLGLVVSSQPTPDASIRLFDQGLALAPTHAGLLSDLGTSYLIRYQQTKKKKDLDQAMTYLEKSTAADPTSAPTWQQLAHGYFYRADYPKAWEAVHKGQNLSMTSIDFDFIAELQAKLPDPQGMFK
jgi:Tfp pilus assembly protein PilF